MNSNKSTYFTLNDQRIPLQILNCKLQLLCFSSFAHFVPLLIFLSHFRSKLCCTRAHPHNFDLYICIHMFFMSVCYGHGHISAIDYCIVPVTWAHIYAWLCQWNSNSAASDAAALPLLWHSLSLSLFPSAIQCRRNRSLYIIFIIISATANTYC